MKKIIYGILLILFAVSGTALPVNAEQSGECGTNLEWVLSDDGVLEISGAGEMSTSIPWKNHKSEIKKVVISEGVTSVAREAFRGCDALTEITIGKDVTTIGEIAFYQARALEKIIWNAKSVADFTNASQQFDYAGKSGNGIELIFGEGVERIPAYAFYAYGGASSAPKVTSVIMSDTVESVGMHAFERLEGLTSVKMSKGLKIVGDYAFSSNSILADVEWSNVLESIGTQAFNGCSSLKNAIIPDTVTELGEKAFYCCSSAKELYIGENITTILPATFYKMESLEKITWNAKNVADFTNIGQQFDYAGKSGNGIELIFGEGVERIPAYAFYPYSGNMKTKSINIAESVKKIGNNAFYKCTQTERVNITDLSKWCNIEFENGYSNPLSYGAGLYLNGVLVENISIPANAEKVEDYAFYNYKYAKKVEIPSNVKTIGKDTFKGCSEVTTVAIDCGIESIGSGAFSGFSAIESISFEGFKEDWKKVQIGTDNEALDNISFVDDPGDTPIAEEGAVDENIVWVVYENGMLKITGFGDMIDISGLDIPWDKVTSVVIGDGITSISEGAFKDKDITKVVLGKDVEEMGDEAFQNCDKLEDVYLPAGLGFIGASAFDGCHALTDIRYSGSNLDWDLIQFGGNDTGLPGGNVIFGGTPTTNTKVKYNDKKQTITISSLEETDAILVGATYGKNKEVLEVKYVPVEIKTGRNTFESPITNFADAYTVKFFIWKDISSIMSLCEPYVIQR